MYKQWTCNLSDPSLSHGAASEELDTELKPQMAHGMNKMAHVTDEMAHVTNEMAHGTNGLGLL